MESPYKGSGQLTREQFLFYEMRTTARLLTEGLTEKEVKARIIEDNLFQFPTERSFDLMIATCLNRLRGLDNEQLVQLIATADSTAAKQTCLYSMMKRYRLINDFMISVIGNKYRQQDFTYSRRDINAFLMQLQEQDDYVASWSESTLKKISSVISRLLIENEYIENNKATRLQPVLIDSRLENAMRANGDAIMLPAFNCLS